MKRKRGPFWPRQSRAVAGDDWAAIMPGAVTMSEFMEWSGETIVADMRRHFDSPSPLMKALDERGSDGGGRSMSFPLRVSR